MRGIALLLCWLIGGLDASQTTYGLSLTGGFNQRSGNGFTPMWSVTSAIPGTTYHWGRTPKCVPVSAFWSAAAKSPWSCGASISAPSSQDILGEVSGYQYPTSTFTPARSIAWARAKSTICPSASPTYDCTVIWRSLNGDRAATIALVSSSVKSRGWICCSSLRLAARNSSVSRSAIACNEADASQIAPSQANSANTPNTTTINQMKGQFHPFGRMLSGNHLSRRFSETCSPIIPIATANPNTTSPNSLRG